MTPAEAIQVLLEAQWSERAIAAAVGTSQPTINRIRRGQRRETVEEAVVRLAENVAANVAAPKAEGDHA